MPGTKALLKGPKAEKVVGSSWLHTAWGLPAAQDPSLAPSFPSHGPTYPLPLWPTCPSPQPSQASRPPAPCLSNLMSPSRLGSPSLLEALPLPQRVSPKGYLLQTVHKHLQRGHDTTSAATRWWVGPFEGLCASSHHNA